MILLPFAQANVAVAKISEGFWYVRPRAMTSLRVLRELRALRDIRDLETASTPTTETPP
jgi:hypothetical protein